MPTTQDTLATAIASLSTLSSEHQASFDDLVALNTARECINELFFDCVDELSADPRATPLLSAITSAIELTAPPANSKRSAGSSQATASDSRENRRVAKFWDTFAEQFAWDFLPMEFLHALYTKWMSERFAQEAPLSKHTFTRRLRTVVDASGEWRYIRSRPGSRMNAREPLAKRLDGWSHDGSDDAIYGLRRRGA